jgi:dipeptidyl aminopeptidase/acylaminoacyl peptidase
MRWFSSCANSSVSTASFRREARKGWPRISAVVLCGLCFTISATSASAQRPFALDDMAAFRTITDLAVSPDGTYAIFAVRATLLEENRTQTDLWGVPVDGAGPARQLTDDKAAESTLRWSPDGKRLAFVADRDGSRQVWALPLAGGEASQLTSHAPSVETFDWSPDGKQLAIVAEPPLTEDESRRRRDKDDSYLMGEQWRNTRLWIMNLGNDDAPKPLTDGSRHVESAVWSPDGRFIAIVVAPNAEADGSEDARAQIVEVASKQVRDIPGSDRAGSLKWSPDGKRLAFVRAFDGRGISREDLHVWDAASKAGAKNVSAALDRDVEALSWTPDGQAIDVLISRGAVHALARIDATTAAVASQVFSHSIGVLSRADGGWVYARTDRPAELVAATSGRDARTLTAINGVASQVQLPSSEVIRWRSPVGDVEGVLFKPHDAEPTRRYPLIVYPHGGPRGHSNLDFDPMMAYWASLGYAVLKPNFRGSTGYGDAFTKANIGDWGNGPFQDVMAGVDHLIATGVADPNRLFMYGWSYGGIMANWATTHTDRFKAIASGAGVADARMQYSISDSRRWRFDYFKGSPFLADNFPLYAHESPVNYAKQARTPTLFVHGVNDRRCPLPQGLMMYRALKDNGVTAEMLMFPREDHGFVEPNHILDRAKRVAEWFKRFDVKGVTTESPNPRTSRTVEPSTTNPAC